MHKTLCGLKDQVVQTTKKTEILDNVITFVKDLVFGLLFIFTSNRTYHILIEAVRHITLGEAEYNALKTDPNFQVSALNFFNKYTGMIEIVRDQQTEHIFFPIMPYAEALQLEQKNEWLQKLPVGKAREKLDFFMNDSIDFTTQLKNEYLFAKIFRYTPVFGALAKQIPLWKLVVYILVRLHLKIVRPL